MRKKYVSPLFAELELELENILFDSEDDVIVDGSDEDFGSGDSGDTDFDFDF